MNENYDKQTGEDSFHLINESPVSFYLTYVVPKSSPFISVFNCAILEARDYGFSRLATKKTKTYEELSKMRRYKRLMDSSGPKTLTLTHVRDIFIFYGICILICCITFLIEILKKFL